jgi:hypothetical protein
MMAGQRTLSKGAIHPVPDDLQLTLGAFDRTLPPLCNASPDRNGFRRLCCRCPHAVRERGAVYCTVFDRPITARDKYGLREWKAVFICSPVPAVGSSPGCTR